MLEKILGFIPKEKRWLAFVNVSFAGIAFLGSYLTYQAAIEEKKELISGCDLRAKRDSATIATLQATNERYMEEMTRQNQQGQELLNDFFRQKNAIENIKKTKLDN